MQGYAGTAPTGAEGWRGTLTLPRLVSCAADGTLRFATPYNAFPSTAQSDGPTAITARKQALPFTHCLCWALTIEVRWRAIDAQCLELELLACADGCIRLQAVPASRAVCLTRYDAAGTAQKVGQVVCTTGEKDCLSLHIIVDHSCVDIFLNDGSAVLTTNFYPVHGQVCSSLRAIGGTATLETCHQCALA